MIEIKQARVTNISTHLTENLLNRQVIIGIRADQTTEMLIRRAGFEPPLEIGQSILPRISGSVSRFNSQGKEIPLRNEPMETLYRHMEFTRMEWHGQDRVEVTGFVWIPYKRYPRRLIPAPEVHMNVIESPDNTKMIVTDYIECSPDNYPALKHQVNLFLEIFGECFILEQGENPLIIPGMTKLYWDILPPGQHPWDRIRESITDSLERQAPKALAAALNRFEKISTLNPDFTAVGNGGYRGYVVFGFSVVNLFVLDSQKPNNAIYVFGENWQSLSQLTKAEILQGNLHTHRIIHTENWFRELQRALAL